MLTVGVVGLGKMGILHSAVLGSVPNVRVLAVCERKGLVRRFAKSALPGVQIVSELADLASLRLDAVYVATLPASHSAIVKEIYDKGIARNVFVEKSLASSHAQAEEMCRLADAAGGVHAVGFQKRYGGTFRKAKELLDAGAIGDVASFDAYAYSSDFAAAGSAGGTAASRGGVLRDQGSHAIDLALWFFGDLEVVLDHDSHEHVDAPADFSFGRVSTSEGAEGTFSVSAELEEYRLPEIGMTIVGSGGEMRVNDDRLELSGDGTPRRWHRQDLDDSRVSFLLGDPEYTRETVAFVDAVVDGNALEGPDFHAGARVERVIDGILAG